jgi:hypothetical protein
LQANDGVMENVRWKKEVDGIVDIGDVCDEM